MEINGIARRIDVMLADFAAAIGEYIQKIDPEPRLFTPGWPIAWRPAVPGICRLPAKHFFVEKQKFACFLLKRC